MALKAPWLKIAVIGLAALVVYIPAMGGGLVWDDSEFVGSRLMLAGADGLRQMWFTTQARDYFPLTNTTFWIEWRLWGANAAGCHVTNILLHAAAAVLLWRVLEQLSVPGAWLAGLIFAVHPLNVESVAWISERKNTLSLVFCAAGLLAYLKFDRGGARRWYGWALGFFALALLSKTSVVMLPVALLGCAWWRRGRICARDLLRTLPFFALSLVMGLVTVWFQHQHSMAGEPLNIPWMSRIAAAGCAVWFYLLKAVAPVNLCTIYAGWTPRDTATLSIWPALALAALFALFWAYRKRWGRPFLFGLGYYVVMLLPALGFFDMYIMKLSLVMDHFQYPALIGVIALIIGLAAHGLERSGAHLGKLAPVAAAGLVGVLGLHTWQQAAIYRSGFTLWTDTLDKNPGSWTAYNNLAAAHIELGSQPGADPAFKHAQADLALQYARKALEMQPDYPNAQFNIGRAYQLLDQPEKAVAPFREAVRLWPKLTEWHANLADALYRSGEVNEAMAEYHETLRLQPDSPEIRFNLADALLKQNRVEEAAQEYRTLLEAHPHMAEAHNNLGRLLAGQGKIGEAVAHYREAVADRPESAKILDNLAWLKACIEDDRFRDGAEALALATRAYRIAGDEDVKALDTLAAACAATGRFDDAVRYARKASDLASAAGQKAKVEQIGKRIELYQARQPLRLGPGIPLE
jgi:tetratricopeptide (TPR) repeat protein